MKENKEIMEKLNSIQTMLGFIMAAVVCQSLSNAKLSNILWLVGGLVVVFIVKCFIDGNKKKEGN